MKNYDPVLGLLGNPFLVVLGNPVLGLLGNPVLGILGDTVFGLLGDTVFGHIGEPGFGLIGGTGFGRTVRRRHCRPPLRPPDSAPGFSSQLIQPEQKTAPGIFFTTSSRKQKTAHGGITIHTTPTEKRDGAEEMQWGPLRFRPTTGSAD